MTKISSDIILFDSEGKILLQHRTEDAPTLPGYWSIFGGGIEKGETPEEAVRRECLEELNYQLENPKLVMSQEVEAFGGTRYVFMEKYDPSKKLELLEGQGMGWFTLEETKELKIVDHEKEVIDL
ncbi:MAG: NUDIX hydrolase [Nanoarchaeota archaeon]|nr:NUDIX hydrolase [Nanoarchaeota archaeon]